MASETAVINRALSKLGANRISARSDPTKNAREMDANYDLIRDYMLRAFTWRFTIARKQLSALSTTPAFGYDYEYQLPTDCLRVIQVGESYVASLSDYRTADESPFAIEGRKLLTDLTAPLSLRYVSKVENAQLFDACFVEALACKLAAETCEAITGSTSKKQELRDELREAIGAAILANALEVPPTVIPDDSWMLARIP